jgi:hypothetical protein
MRDWKEQFLAATHVPQPLCAVPGCLRPAAVAWRERNDCVSHFLETAQDYVGVFQISKDNSDARYPERAADPELLTECILRGAALLTSEIELDRYEEAHLLRLLSDCHALLRLGRLQSVVPARSRAASTS